MIDSTKSLLGAVRSGRFGVGIAVEHILLCMHISSRHRLGRGIL